MQHHASNLIKLIKAHTPDPKSGAEVGVWKGRTSAEICKAFPGCLLHMIDTWKSWPQDSSYFAEHQQMGILTDDEWSVIYQTAIQSVMDSGGAFSIHRNTSEEAAHRVVDCSLDFVFLDANHTYEEVKKDILLWTPKVRAGGFVSGHDYGGIRDRNGQWGVARSVHEIFGKNKVIPPIGRSRVWAVVKE